MKVASILLFLIVWSATYSQQAANQFRRIDAEWGLSNNQINTIFSDSKGVIWFATVSGLNRYDGYAFKVFKNVPGDPTSLPENSIHRMYEDHLGYFWLFTTNRHFIFDPRTEKFGTDHELFHKNVPLPTDNISSIRVGRDSTLWISNSFSGVYHYHPAKDYISHLQHQQNDSGSISSDRVTDVVFCNAGFAYLVHHSGVIDVVDPVSLAVIDRIFFNADVLTKDSNRGFRLFIDSDGDFWIYAAVYGDGVIYLNRLTGATRVVSANSRPYALSNNLISGIVEDRDGRIWVATDHGGINVINKRTQSIEQILCKPGDVTSLSSNVITSIHKSSDGIIWIGTFKNGINYYHERLYQFQLFRSLPYQQSQFFSNDVNCFAEDRLGNLWIGTNGNGLVYFDRAKNSFRTYRHIPGDTNSLSSDIIVSLCIDHKDRLWIGTYQGGLNSFDGRRFTHYRHSADNPSGISDDRVWQILEDSRNRLWIGTLGGGLSMFDERTNSFVHHREGDFNSISSDFVLALNEDSQGNIWIGTSAGLTVLDATTNRFRHYIHDENNPSGISHSSVLSILEDAKGRLWIGTRNGLNLFDRERNVFKVIRETDGLPDHNIITMLDDGKGDIWIATLNGLSNLVTTNDGSIAFRNYDLLDGLQGLEFNEHSALKTSAGELIFGGGNGFNLFIPNNITGHERDFPVILTDFKLMNRSVGIGEKVNGHVVLNQAIGLSSEVSLRHNQNVFAIGFSALNYFHPERTRFRYKLEGFNNDWIETDSRNRLATYTNLNPGVYLFRVMASASDGSWNEHETTLTIRVIPPFYATSLAYLIYFVLFVLLILLLIFTIRRRERMHYLREQEKAEYYRMRDLDAMKTRFFTNVSHEFRTPLTLILTPLDKLLKEVKDAAIREQLTLIGRNAKRLLNLVNQLLDFRKLEVDKISLNKSYGDIVRFISDGFNSFIDLFESKSIACSISSNMERYMVHFDQDKMEKILFNLLSNAVKFTPENGRIHLHLLRCEPHSSEFLDCFNGLEYLEIQVRDSGIGISPERQERIFDRFFQIDDNATIINQGSGIGLSLTQEFVKMHGGTIHVESEPGNGSAFIVRLPLNDEVVAREELPDSPKAEPDFISQDVAESNEHLVDSNKKPTLLIVEDNEDLRFYLKENLKQNFTILEAPNGFEGWEKTLSAMPGLVVSDIMMPVEDGIALCRRIKGDARTSHIPVILLTARTANEQKLEGLEAGAEDYITKPFNYEILELKIKRLIEMRQSFQHAFSRKFEIKPGEIGITSLDEKFLNKALKIVEKNIGNSEFSVERMGRELGVSRGHLYNKILALTGKTPVEFIRLMRLKRAAQYLAKSQQTVSEIAFMVGFNDPKYFSKYFKDEFGVVPSEYARNPKDVD
ncbi:hybrid sensor histidine kinase/response regulator transcription factor [Alkaliflexus imshenetskii]|uniref:hybrid sensor histidine kinase/response regulator transcription factor n=1 Tax=Alkaliflexus imshenetskii TaxID=286730 RepID=UPI0004B3FF17|nr:hybrid sensor histidine kinase/response regulator transcription factor [Alkaliflexus imshenetskii]